MSEPTRLLTLGLPTVGPQITPPAATDSLFTARVLEAVYVYAFADRAAAIAYWEAQSGFQERVDIDGSTSVFVFATDNGYASGVASLGGNVCKWSDLAKGPDVTLSVDKLTATVASLSADQQGVRGTLARGPGDGKRAFEIHVTRVDGIVLGWTTGNGANFPGREPRGWAIDGTSGQLLHNDGSGYVASGAGYAVVNEDIWTFGYDTDAGTLKAWRLGVLVGTMFGGMVDALFPSMGNAFGAGAHFSVGELNCSSLVYLPAGYTAWND